MKTLKVTCSNLDCKKTAPYRFKLNNWTQERVYFSMCNHCGTKTSFKVKFSLEPVDDE